MFSINHEYIVSHRLTASILKLDKTIFRILESSFSFWPLLLSILFGIIKEESFFIFHTHMWITQMHISKRLWGLGHFRPLNHHFSSHLHSNILGRTVGQCLFTNIDQIIMSCYEAICFCQLVQKWTIWHSALCEILNEVAPFWSHRKFTESISWFSLVIILSQMPFFHI